MSTTSIILGCDLQVGDYVESVTEEPLFSDTRESIPIGVSVTLHCRRQNKKFSQTIASKPPNTPRPPFEGQFITEVIKSQPGRVVLYFSNRLTMTIKLPQPIQLPDA